MNKKGYLDISFSWLFAIIIGIIIIFGAIYGVTKFSRMGGEQSGAEAGAQLENILNPVETGIESGKIVYVKMPVESKIENNCDLVGTFGNQIISVSEKIKKKWEPGTRIIFQNKYIFSGSSMEDKGFYIFSKSFDFPFKVGSVMYFIPESKKYCFLGVPEEISEEIKNLNNKNLLVENCSTEKNYVKVCFISGKLCDIVVSYDSNIVKKGNSTFYFETDALMYAAIFSDKKVYDCQVNRLMKRTEELTKIYEEKSMALESKYCNSGVLSDLALYKDSLEDYNSTTDLQNLYKLAEDIDKKNNYAKCKLW